MPARQVLIDANLLVLFVVGKTDRQLMPNTADCANSPRTTTTD